MRATGRATIEEKIKGRILHDDTADSYRAGARILIRINTLLAAATVGLAFLFLYAVSQSKIDDRYFAMSFDGRKMRMTALETPSLNVNAMLRWTADAAADIMTFGFNDINVRMSAVKPYFTEVGWQSFTAAVRKSSIIQTLVSQQQLLTTIPIGMPVIEYEGLREGYYVWDIRVPVAMAMRAGKSLKTAYPNLVVTVMKVPTRDNPRGLGIQKWVMY